LGLSNLRCALDDFLEKRASKFEEHPREKRFHKGAGFLCDQHSMRFIQESGLPAWPQARQIHTEITSGK